MRSHSLIFATTIKAPLKVLFLVLILVLLSISLFSCSSLRKNVASKSQFSIRGISQGQMRLNESLQFKRYSWYQEMNLLFDLYVTKIQDDSPFSSWFSSEEKRELAKCQSSFIALSYAMDDKKIPPSLFNLQLQKLGFEKISLSNFARSLYTHPDSEDRGFKLYQVNGFCSSKPYPPNEITISFPSFLDSILSI